MIKLLRQNVREAVWYGFLFNSASPLRKFDSDRDVVDEKELPNSLSEKDFGFVLYSANERGRSKLKERLIKDFGTLNRKRVRTTEWCSSLGKQLKALVQRRISRVKDWILLNTKVFKDDSDVTHLRQEAKLNYFDPIRQFWTICQQKCQKCDRLCLKQSYHNDDQIHDCYTDHKCEYNCSYCNSGGKCFACGHCGGHSGKHQCKEKLALALVSANFPHIADVLKRVREQLSMTSK